MGPSKPVCVQVQWAICEVLKFFYIYIFLLHLGPALNLTGLLPGGRVFPITTVAHFLMAVIGLSYFAVSKSKKDPMTKLDLSILVFIIWSIISVVLFLQPNNPSAIGAYFYGLHLAVFPMFGYFAIKVLPPAEQRKVIVFALWSNMFLIVLGLYLWWARPEYYTAFLREMIFNRAEDVADWVVYARLQSYLGSTVVGVLCAITITMAGLLRLNFVATLFVLAACLPAVVLSSQRGGMAGCAIALVYLLLAPRRDKFAKWGVLAAAVAVVPLFLFYITQDTAGGLNFYLSRKDDFNNMLEGRRAYTVGFDYITAFPMGVGLGGTMNASNGAGLLQWDKVVDSNFMRICADLGIQGLLMFLVILGFGLQSAIRRNRNVGHAVLIGIYAVICTGTNVLDGHIAPQLFWMFLAIADTPQTTPSGVEGRAESAAEIEEEVPGWPVGLQVSSTGANNTL